MIHDDARFSRQELLVHDDFKNAVIVVAGVGMLGGWSTLALARIAKLVMVFDHDTVEDVNSGNQPYAEREAMMTKVEAIASIGSGLPIVPFHSKFDSSITRESVMSHGMLALDPDPTRKLVVVSGVDSMAGRTEVATWALKNKADVFIDTRALGELIVTFTVPPHMLEHYLSHEILDDKDAPEAQCGEQGTSYAGMAVASRVCIHLNSFFRGRQYPYALVEHIGLNDIVRRDMPVPIAAPVTAAIPA